jgi:hypothetical protein
MRGDHLKQDCKSEIRVHAGAGVPRSAMQPISAEQAKALVSDVSSGVLPRGRRRGC